MNKHVVQDPSLSLILLRKLCVKLSREIAPTSMTNAKKVSDLADDVIEQANLLKEWSANKKS